jgi:hypothetical protein
MAINSSSTIILSTVLCAASASVAAAPITYHLSGTLYWSDAAFSSIDSNADWNAWFTIDDATGDSSADPLLGKYHGVAGEISIDGTVITEVNQSTFSNTFINVGNEWVYVDPDYDFLDFNGDQTNGAPMSPATIDGYQISVFEIGIADWTGAIFTSTNLSDTLSVSTGDFQGSMFLLKSGTHEINGLVSTVTVTTVPIPGAAWLFGSGFLALLGMARRK